MSMVSPLFANGRVAGWSRSPWAKDKASVFSRAREIVVPDAASTYALMDPGKPPTSSGPRDANSLVKTDVLRIGTSGAWDV
jgi:hypothetical protein